MKKIICCILSICMAFGILNISLPVSEVKAETEAKATVVEYTVNVKSSGGNRFLLCNKVPVEKGQKVTLTYTVESTNLGTSVGPYNGFAGTNEDNLKNHSIGYAATSRLAQTDNRVVRNGLKHTFTLWLNDSGQIEFTGGAYRADGSLEDYASNAGGYFNAGPSGTGDGNTKYLGILMYADTTAKLTHVTCVDENGNDLGVQMNKGVNGSVKAVEKPVVEYTVDMKDTAPGESRFLLCSGQATTGPITLSYTVESSNHKNNATANENTTGNNGLIAVTDTRLKNGSYNYLQFSNGYNRMLVEGWSYTITMSWDSVNKKIVYSGGYKESDGTYTELDAVHLNQAGMQALDSESPEYLGIAVFNSTTTRLTHVTCVDAVGNDLGVRTNQTQKCKIEKMAVEYTVDVKNSGSNRFLLCNKIPVEKGKKVTLTYTVESTNLETSVVQYNGFAGTNEDNLKNHSIGYAATSRLARTDNRVVRNGLKHIFTLWLNDSGQIEFTGGAYRADGSLEDYASNAGGYFNAGLSGTGDGNTKYLGILMYADTTAKLTHVTCVDENGNDLGVQMNKGVNGTIVSSEITTEAMKLHAYDNAEFAAYRNSHTAPAAIRGYAFAGWYTDAEGKEPVKATDTVTHDFVFAKYVPEGVLSVKLQLKKGTTATSEKTDMRLITSVDSTQYQEVGFAVTAKVSVDGTEKNQTKTYAQSVCYSTLNGAGVTYYPSEFHDASEKFVTSLLQNMPIKDSDLSKEITIVPYWKTLDGTIYYGVSRTITKQQALDATA